MACFLHHHRVTKVRSMRRTRPRRSAALRVALAAALIFASTSVSAAPEPEHQRLDAFIENTALRALPDPTPQIIPGVQVGPVKIGMSAYDAAGVALAFEHATGCQIDLLIVAGRVVAAGTRFGGCLRLSLPDAARNVATTVGLASVRWDPVMDGPASDFVAAFGRPREVGLNANRLALIWPQGLVAHVSGIHEGDGNVTYLAVVAPATTEVPLIGYLRISLP